MLITLEQLTKKFDLRPHQIYKHKLENGVENFCRSCRLDYQKVSARRIEIHLNETTAQILLKEMVESRYISKTDAAKTKYIDYLTNFKEELKKEEIKKNITTSQNKSEEFIEEIKRLYSIDEKFKTLDLNDDELLNLVSLHEILKDNKIEIFKTHLIIKKQTAKLTQEGEETLIVFKN